MIAKPPKHPSQEALITECLSLHHPPQLIYILHLSFLVFSPDRAPTNQCTNTTRLLGPFIAFILHHLHKVLRLKPLYVDSPTGT